LRLTLAYLLVTPSAFQKLRDEIDDGVKNGKVSSPVKDAETKQLPYLQACIKEALRLTPPATGLLHKRVPKGGDVIHGFFVPEDTQIGVCMYGLGHKTSFWGEDADVFRPDRWFEADD
jgi:cytochrome P450